MEQEVCRIIGAMLGKTPEQIGRNDSLKKLGLDSVQRLEMVMEIEDLYDTVISDEEGESFMTVADVIACLDAKKNNQPAAE